jgi:hypothetical protein
MSDVSDLMLPILKSLQDDMSFVRKDLVKINAKLEEIDYKIDQIEHWAVQALGLATIAKNQADLAHVEIKALKRKNEKVQQ